jgi:hypothetical protein
MTPKTAAVISFGLGGHHIDVDHGEGYGAGSISGYDSPESFERNLAADRKSSYPPLAHVPVIDKRTALEADYGLAIRSPMCSAKLAPGEVNRFADILPDPADSLVVQAFAQGNGQQQGLAAMAVAASLGSFSGMDFVAADLYVEWWRTNGARIGRMDETGKVILWDA